MEEALRALLLADPTIAAAVDDRVHWILRPQGEALPAVVLQLIAGAPGRTYDGADNLTGASVQADCWGRTYAEAKGLARAVKAAALGRQAAPLEAVFLDAERDDVERDAPETFHRTSLDLRVWHKA